MNMEIKFTLDETEIKRAKRIVSADDAYYALVEITELLREEYKYNENAPAEYLEMLRDKVTEIIDDSGVNLDDYD